MSEPQLRLIPDCGPLITEIALYADAELFTPAGLARRAAYGALIGALPPAIALFVLCQRQTAPHLRDWFTADFPTRDFYAVTAGSTSDPSLGWIQDPVLAATDGRTRVFIQPRHSDRDQDHAVWLAHHFGAPLLALDADMAGGNLLVAADFMIAGAAAINRTVNRYGSAGLQRLKALNPRLHIFGSPGPDGVSLSQEPFHIDLAVSLTGLSRDGQPVLLVADPRVSDSVFDFDNAWADGLDGAAARLRADGFHVIRNPIPVTGTARHPHRMIPRCYNNVLLENEIRPGTASGRPLVWLPVFGTPGDRLADFDAANAAIWAGLGFEVIAVPGFEVHAGSYGALRCALKVLARRGWCS